VENAAYVAAAVVFSLNVIFFVLLWVSYRSKKPKRLLRIRELPYTSLITMHDDIKGAIVLTYNRKPVSSAGSVSIQLSNAGNSPIKTEDFRTPPTFSFGRNNQAIEVAQEEVEGENITPLVDKLQQPVDSVQISDGFLLNPRQTANLKFTVLEGRSESAKINFHEEGIVDGKIQKSVKGSNALNWLFGLTFFCNIIVIVIFSTNSGGYSTTGLNLEPVIGQEMIVSGFILFSILSFIAFIVLKIRERK
jgi:hypothetical protein